MNASGEESEFEAPAYLGREFPGRRAPYSVGPQLYGLVLLVFLLLVATLIFLGNANIVGFVISGSLFVGSVNLAFFAIRKQVRADVGHRPRKYDR